MPEIKAKIRGETPIIKTSKELFISEMTKSQFKKAFAIAPFALLKTQREKE